MSSRADAYRLIAEGFAMLASAEEEAGDLPVPQQPRRLISRVELLDHLGISGPTLTKLEKAGTVPFVRVGDLHRYDLAAVISALENAPKPEPGNVVRLTRAGGPRSAGGAR